MTNEQRKELEDYVNYHANQFNLAVTYAWINAQVFDKPLKPLNEFLEEACKAYKHSRMNDKRSVIRVDDLLRAMSVGANKYLTDHKKFIDNCIKGFKSRTVDLSLEFVCEHEGEA